MAKIKTSFFCKSCGYESPKWLGKCSSCGEWNTFSEEIKPSKQLGFSKSNSESKPINIIEVETGNEERIYFDDMELNSVLGGGLVKGSISLLGGEPGIGKSTLMLQIAVKESQRVLYVSGEESEMQIRMRAERIGIKNKNCVLLTETNINAIVSTANELLPDFLVIDSIQTCYNDQIENSQGSITQVKECTAYLLRFAKSKGIPVVLIGHINKEGSIAGPKLLEHMVDTVLQFEGEVKNNFRILRTLKNRFGPSNEISIYEMTSLGLFPISNPSEFLSGTLSSEVSGVSISSISEGVRVMQIEIQALVSTAAYGTPQRSSTGFDNKRLNMLLAVLEKRCGFKLGAKDVFINVAGGMKIDDPSADLAVAMAVLSSNADITIPKQFTFAAEISLSGELRGVNRIEQRIKEADKFCFKKIILAKNHKNQEAEMNFNSKIKIIACNNIQEVVKSVFA